MVFVEPPKGRAKIVDKGSQVHIVIPLRPRGLGGWLYWLFIVAFLVAWVSMGSVAIAQGFISSSNKPPFLFMVGRTVFWAIATVFLIGWCWQMLVGREEILITPQGLTIRRYPFGRQLHYHLPEVKNLRVLEDVFAATNLWWWLLYQAWLPYAGVLAFDYGATTVRFGMGLDPAEARQIVEMLRDRFGEFMKADAK